MGYTHYWTITTVNADVWLAMLDDCKKALGSNPLLCYEYNAPASFNIDVCFNGKGDAGHETFLLQPVTGFSFCKTAGKPYDTAVCAALIIAKHHMGDGITVHSDGTWDEWKEGRELVRSMLGYEIDGLDTHR